MKKEAFEEHSRLKWVWELPIEEYVLAQDVRRLMGPIAAASLECVLLDGLQRFVGISEGEISLIRQLAKFRKVELLA
jgi:hypothetical protein